MKWLSEDDNLENIRFHFMSNGGLQSLNCDGKVVGGWLEDESDILLKVDESKSDQKWELYSNNQKLVSFYIVSNDGKVLGMNDQGEVEMNQGYKEDQTSKVFFYGPDSQFVN